MQTYPRRGLCGPRRSLPPLYVPNEIIMWPKGQKEPNPPKRPHEGDIDVFKGSVDSDNEEAYHRALAPNVEGPTDWSRVEHPFGKISRPSHYVHASTDTSEDHALKNRPLPFKYKHPSPRPAPHEPKEEWLLLWDIIYNEEMANKKFSTRVVPVEEQRKLFGRKYWAPGVWPVNRIVGQRQTEGRKEYLIEWERHPRTREEWESTWTNEDDVAEDLVEPWWKACRKMWWKQHAMEESQDFDSECDTTTESPSTR